MVGLKWIGLIIVLVWVCLPDAIYGGLYDQRKIDAMSDSSVMNIKVTVGGKIAKGILYNNATGRDFAALLPMTILMEDYNRTEKIVELKKALSIKDAPSGFDPDAGDLTYYEPWGNIALFYKDFGYSNGLVSLGKITQGLALFAVKGSLRVTIEMDQYPKK